MLKNAFHIRYNGIIWKIRPDETGQYLVCEIRNADKKTTTFSCIRTTSGQHTFDQLQLREPWFCGLEGAAHGIAILHGYLSETLPEHRGLFAVELNHGRVAWEDYNLVFDSAVREGLVAWNYKSEPRRYQLIDPRDGSGIRQYASAAERDEHTTLLPYPPLQFPSSVSLDDAWRAKLPAGSSSVVDALDWKGYRIMSFYSPGNEAAPKPTESESNKEAGGERGAGGKNGTDGNVKQPADHQIYVVDAKGEIVHRDFLAKGILQPALDTFFVMDDRLYYIKSKAEILAYFL